MFYDVDYITVKVDDSNINLKGVGGLYLYILLLISFNRYWHGEYLETM